MWKWIITSLVIVLLVATVSVGYWIYQKVAEKEHVTIERFEKFKDRKPRKDLPHIGYDAPKFELSNERNERVGLDAEKPTLVVFWTEWSSNCQEEIEKLAQMYPQHETNLRLYFINDTTNDEEQKARRIITKYGLEANALYDRTSSIVEEYGIKVYPTSFLVGTDGKIADRIVGGMEEEKWKEVMERFQTTKK